MLKFREINLFLRIFFYVLCVSLNVEGFVFILNVWLNIII